MTLSLLYDDVLSRVRITGTGLSVTDAFGRTVTGGWGTADTGHVWVVQNAPAADYAVGSGKGTITHTAVNVTHIVSTGAAIADVDMTAEFSVPVTATGGSIIFGLLARHTDADNHYRCELLFDATGNIDLSIWRRIGAVSTQLASLSNVIPYTPGAAIKARFEVVGTTLRARVWEVTEPSTWQVEATDTTWATGAVGVRSILSSANTNTLPLTVSIDNFSALPTVKVERSTNQVVWSTVRGGQALIPAAGAISLDDYEFAADTRNFYRAVGQDGYGPALNPNTSFEVDTTGWAAGGASIERSTVRAHEGVASLLITPDGVSGSGGAIAGRVPVVVGETYQASLWAWATESMQIGPAIDWFTALVGGSYISTGFVGPVTIPAGVWVPISGPLVAPAGATAASIRARHGGTPSVAQTWWADEVTISPLGITPVLGSVWLKSLARPFLNRRVTVWDWSPVQRASRSGVFPIVGRSFPVAVTDLHGSRQWTLQVRTWTPQEARDLDLLISTGEVQFVHVPANSGVPGGYVALGNTSEEHFALGTIPQRVISMPLIECAAPGADIIPAVGTCQTVLNTYSTCADVLAAHPTCADLLQLVGSLADVIVP